MLYWDNERQKNVARVLPGESYVATEGELIETLLGSCVSVCMRDARQGIGGMNHFFIPETGRNIADNEKNRYGVFAMKSLIEELEAQGASRLHLEVKVAGGGRVIDGMVDIGRQNIQFARLFLENLGIRPAAIDVGGTCPRQILYDPVSGKLLIRRLGDRDRFRTMAYEVRYRLRTVASTSPYL